MRNEQGEWKELKFDGDALREYGINMLTGEACGISMRLLCDLTEEGYDLIVDFFGGATPTHSAMNRGKACIMLSRDTLRDIVIFGALRNGANNVVAFEYDRYSNARNVYKSFVGTIDQLRHDLELYKQYDWVKIGRSWDRSGTAHDGMANRHEMSGRVY
jgi:hypothetical protein